MPRPWSKSTLIAPSDITSEDKFLSRRALLAGGLGIAVAQAFAFERRASPRLRSVKARLTVEHRTR
jgi:hypothetical protein